MKAVSVKSRELHIGTISHSSSNVLLFGVVLRWDLTKLSRIVLNFSTSCLYLWGYRNASPTMSRLFGAGDGARGFMNAR